MLVSFGWDSLCGLTGGRLGGHGPREWPWKVPLGKPVRDEDGWLTNSLAGRLFDLEQWVLDVGYGPDDKAIRVPLTRDQAMEIDPRFTTEWESLDEDEA